MKATGIAVSPLFAVPFGQARIGDCEPLNRALESVFLANENDAHRNPTPSHITQQEMFESRFNLFTWPDACVQELRRFVLDSVGSTVLQASTIRPDQLASLKLHNHSWFHITRYAGSFIAHNHPLASWSAVYCVRAGDRLPAEADSGLLRFFDPRSGAEAFQDPANSQLRPAFAHRTLQMQLEEGQLVVFPSYIFHEVAPYYGQSPRITVAVNCWFA